MAQSTSTIKDSCTLFAFAKKFGPKMQVGHFVNHEDGEMFSSCIFTDLKGTKTFVGFSSGLGELTPKEIVSMKDDLQVVQLESGSYRLCKQGSNWEDVDLGL